MARPHPTLLNLLLIILPICLDLSFAESNDLLSCRDDIENCATTHLDTNLSLYDIFELMKTNISRLEQMCEIQRRTFHPCIERCILEFLASKYSYLENVCSFKRWIVLQKECWTQQWLVEARECYRWLYPHFSTEYPRHGLYPIPYRVYDRASIARECFPTSRAADDKCSYYQTWIFQKLLPHYYEMYGYPEEFEHIPDSIGFPANISAHTKKDCTVTHRDTYSTLYNVFDMKTTNVSRLEESCEINLFCFP
ncbi:hypothetical protein RRG08_030845 [Elysia crispata]|uniref:Uncharacterized protein n=1 Tax=Elysia crispata TaxID=231223 RepID=A0AAE1CLS2_9GAST|nr:hypothetical protein RRG08_030845 [Elysia crispata]